MKTMFIGSTVNDQQVFEPFVTKSTTLSAQLGQLQNFHVLN